MSWSRTNQLVIAAAERLGVVAEPLSSEPSDWFMVLRDPLRAGQRAVIVSKTRSPFLTQVAQTLSNNKHVSRQRLLAEGLPCVPDRLVDSAVAQDDDELCAWLSRYGRLVVKPNWGNRGHGVSLGMTTMEALVHACARARQDDLDEEAVVEPEISGINVRVAVIGGRFEAAAQVERPVLVGDGATSPAAWIDALNEDPRRGSWERPGLHPLDRIEIDEELERLLDHHGVGLDAPLPVGARVEILGEEAETIDVTEVLHPGWFALCERACALLGVDVGGVDLRGPEDAFREPPPARWRPGEAALLEVNVLPALHLHALPTQGTPRPVFEAFVAYCVERPGAPPPCAEVGLGRSLASGLSTSV
jgi:D-alanine-D-alanine ligase-like ATP-grasp enzyme